VIEGGAETGKTRSQDQPSLEHPMVRSSVLAGCCLMSVLVSLAPAQRTARNRQSRDPSPMPAQTWNSRGAGALIEGACTGIRGDRVAIVMGDGVERLVPHELFLPEELEKIRVHFSVTEPVPEQKRADTAPPRAECRMLHTIRGGVLPSGKIVGRNGNLI
jgi:hypothetical protein